MTSSLWNRARRSTGVLLAAVCTVAPAGLVGAQTGPTNEPPTAPSGGTSTDTNTNTETNTDVDADVVPGEYVVMLRSGSARSSDQRSIAGDGLSSRIDAVLSRLDKATPEARSGGDQAAAANESPIIAELAAIDGFAAELDPVEAAIVAADPDVASVEPNRVVERMDEPAAANPAAAPTVPPWGLDRIDQPNLPLDETYGPTADGSGVTAYVIDDGVWGGHREFGGRVKPVVDFVGDFPSVDDIDPACMAHGSHVAGTIAGANVGVAPAATVQPVRVFGCNSATVIDILRGMDWVGKNAQLPAVANMSIGAGRSRAINSAIAYLTAGGVTVAVAAGNDTIDACIISPASAPSAITVGASSATDAASGFSNYGECLDVYAPGAGILSVDVAGANKLVAWDGTSMASPHVAGAAALYLSAHPTATPAAVETAIVAGAVSDVLTGVKPASPNKLLQVNGLPDPIAVADNAPVAHITPPAGNGAVEAGSDLVLDGSSSYDPLGGALTYEWRVQDQIGVAGTGPALTTPATAIGTFEVTLKVTNSSGLTATSVLQVDVTDSQPPVVVLDPDGPIAVGVPGDRFTWDASASFDPDGGDVSIRWAIFNAEKDAFVQRSDGPTFSATYPKQLSSVIVVATNEYGAEGYQWINFVSPPTPKAVITPTDIDLAVGDAVTFSSRGSGDNWGIVKFEWTSSELEGVAWTKPNWERTFSEPGTYTVTLKVISQTGANATATATVNVAALPAAMTSITPARVLDTRLTQLRQPGPKGRVRAGKAVRFPVGSVPSSASGVMLNVTAVNPAADGHLTVYPCGSRPNTANVNYRAGATTANSVFAKLGDNHDLCVWTAADSDIVVDVSGYVGADSPVQASSPVRAFDSRTARSARKSGTRVPAGRTVTVDVSDAGVPEQASAVVVNLSAAGPAADGHLTAYPCGQLPPTSNLNYRAGVTRSAMAVVELTDERTFCVRSHAATDIVVDVLGSAEFGEWILPAAQRMYDSRAKHRHVAPARKRRVAAGSMVKVNLGVDAATTAGVVLNVTAVAPGGDGHLTVFPCGKRPGTSSVNYAAGVTTANSVFTKVDASGSVCVWTPTTTDLVVDLAGWVPAEPLPGEEG